MLSRLLLDLSLAPAPNANYQRQPYHQPTLKPSNPKSNPPLQHQEQNPRQPSTHRFLLQPTDSCSNTPMPATHAGKASKPSQPKTHSPHNHRENPKLRSAPPPTNQIPPTCITTNKPKPNDQEQPPIYGQNRYPIAKIGRPQLRTNHPPSKTKNRPHTTHCRKPRIDHTHPPRERCVRKMKQMREMCEPEEGDARERGASYGVRERREKSE